MKKLTKNMLATGGVLAVGATSFMGLGVVNAQSGTTANGNSSIISKIASKFGLKEDEVKAVFDADRAEHEAAREAETKTKLDQAVTDGKITQDQETKIIAKLAELKTAREAEMDSLKDKTEAERREAMKTKMDELKKWATENNIPVEYLRFGGGHGGHGGRGGPGVPGGDDMGQPTTDQTQSTTN